MERIKWKAKPEGKDYWIAGSYLYHSTLHQHFICRFKDRYTTIPEFIPVRISTLCCCIGEKDCKGKEIWENDIVQNSNGLIGIVRIGKHNSGWNHNIELGAYLEIQNDPLQCYRSDIIFWVNDGLEVIGNIFDHPQLLKHINENKQ